jgi:hypothetical protein
MSAHELHTRDGIEVTVKAVSSFKVFQDSPPHPAFVAMELRSFGLRASINMTPAEAIALGALLTQAGTEAPTLPLDDMRRSRPAATTDDDQISPPGRPNIQPGEAPSKEKGEASGELPPPQKA